MPKFPGFPLHFLTPQPSAKELLDSSELWKRYTESDTVTLILSQLAQVVRDVVKSFNGEFPHQC